MRRLQRALVCLCLVLLAGLPPLVSAQDDRPDGVPESAVLATVVAVTDGDTFDAEIDGQRDTVRLIGIDAPETKDPDQPVQCYGPEASARLHKLLPEGKQIWLEPDKTDRDRYERLLRYGWVAKSNGDVYLLNEVLVRDGYAIAKRYPPDTHHAKRLERAQETAKKKGVGLWTACPETAANFERPPTPEPGADTPAQARIPLGGNCDPSYPGVCIPPARPILIAGISRFAASRCSNRIRIDSIAITME